MAGPSDSTPDSVAISRFIERFGLQLAEIGTPRRAARVLAALFIAENGRRTAADLAEVLRVSPAAISGAVRLLGQIGLVIREREAGDRRDYYRLYDGVWYELFARRDAGLGHLEKTLAEGIAAVGVGSEAGARLEDTRLFFEYLRGELPRILDKWRELRATPHSEN